MKVFINFNEYLGGGETLLLRLAKSMSNEPIKVVSSVDSYIHEQLNIEALENTELCMYSGNYNYNYLASVEKESFLNWLTNVLPELQEDIKVITFCLRDLHLIAAFVKKYDRTNIKVTHLLLHPLDHLYLGQTIIDKVLLKACKINNFNAKKNRVLNAFTLRLLADNGSLIPMNYNVLQKLKNDTGIDIGTENIIPLPFSKLNNSLSLTVTKIDNSKTTQIVWLGRIVDFKLSAIKSMIDFIATNEGYSFDIIGYGNETLINKYINLKSVSDKVNIIGKIPPNKLKTVLSHYHIGYGMGTSMAELTLCGLPTIVALASPKFQPFDEVVSAGLVYEQQLGNVGDDLYCTSFQEKKFPPIYTSIKVIEADRQECLNKSLAYIVANFSLEKNIEQYNNVIESAQPVLFNGYKEPRVNIIRKLLFKVFS